MHTEVCDRLGIEFPIFAFSHCRDVVAAVTNAGGFGVLGATGHSPRALEVDLTWIDEHVKGKPYGVDLLLPVKYDQAAALRPAAGSTLPGRSPGLRGRSPDPLRRARTPRPPHRHVRLAQRLPAGGQRPARRRLRPPDPPGGQRPRPAAPPTLASRAHDRDVVVAALVGTAEHARRQQAAGVDLIVAQGTEAGGHTGTISTMVLVPEVVRAVAPVPVLAAGGIVTGAQMAAAMALGAQGVWCGSVWLTTEEAETDPSVQKKMLAASSADTVRSRSLTGKPARMLRSAWTDEWEGEQAPAPLPMPLQTMLTASAQQRINRNAGAGGSGAQELATYFVGQGVGLMDRVRPARQVVEQMVADYLAVAENFAAQLEG